MFGYAESVHPRLSNREIIFEEFPPVWSQSTNVTDGQTNKIPQQYRALRSSSMHHAVNTNHIITSLRT